MTARGVLTGAVAAAVLAAAPAQADVPTRSADCLTLVAGTAGIPAEPLHALLPERGNRALGLIGGSEAPPGLLPAVVPFRDARHSFNRRYEFALRDGRIWLRSSGIREPWRALPLPRCLDGRVTAISADDDQLIALDGERRIFTMDGALGDPLLFTWTLRWGPSLWAGLGRALPAHARAGAKSDLSPYEDVTWTDRAGNAQHVGGGKVSTIYVLRGDGRRITILDPWLPNDDSYEVCGPHRDRFEARTLSASGSTVAVMNRYGDIYTRLWDFDIAGSDPVFFDYSYADQRGAAKPKVQLPAPDWVRHAKVPGEITDRFSMHKVGQGSVHRVLRIEGRDAAGITGYWEKDLPAAEWRFVATGLPLEGAPLENDPARDRSAETLGAPRELAFAGGELAVPDFHPHCTPATLRVTTAGTSFDLVLHSVDGLRQRERAVDLDATPRTYYAAIEVPAAVAASPDARVRAWLAGRLGGRRLVELDLIATSSSLAFPDLGWTLSRAPAASPRPAFDEGDAFARGARKLRAAGVPLPNFARGGLGL